MGSTFWQKTVVVGRVGGGSSCGVSVAIHPAGVSTLAVVRFGPNSGWSCFLFVLCVFVFLYKTCKMKASISPRSIADSHFLPLILVLAPSSALTLEFWLVY